MKEELKQMPKSKCARRFSLSPYAKLEKDLQEWVIDHKRKGIVVTGMAIRMKALKLVEENQSKYNFDSDFRASNGWFCRFKKRNGLGNTYCPDID